MVPFVANSRVPVALVKFNSVIVPFVDQKFAMVPFVVEALTKVDRLAKDEFPETVKLPPR